MLDVILFSPVTIFYGSNGSGKSTLLNVIAEKTAIRYKTKGNSSLYYFNDFIEKCIFEMATLNEKPLKIPSDSRFIRSEDVMEGIVNLRHETIKAENELIKLQAIEGISEREMRGAIQKYNEITEQYSNGETAMAFFENIFKPDTLYLLDEPENSLSPGLQLVLKGMIEKYAYLLGCQFIIATHSPFLLSVENATIYNLDRCPSTVCRWHELENVRTFYDFFKKNTKLFER
jgi:predicted ATPase